MPYYKNSIQEGDLHIEFIVEMPHPNELHPE